jgi:hypothetical protein
MGVGEAAVQSPAIGRMAEGTVSILIERHPAGPSDRDSRGPATGDIRGAVRWFPTVGRPAADTGDGLAGCGVISACPDMSL